MKKSPDLTDKILSYIPDGACILDVGCGDAEFLQTLSGKRYTLLGVDPMIEESASNDILLKKGSAEAIPVPDDHADIILMQCVFSLCNSEAAIRELKRVLKDSGLLIITDLISGTESVDLHSEGLGKILTQEDMENEFSTAFELVAFSDEKKALVQMLIEAIFSDEQLCISCREQAKLKELKAGYGLWIWKKKKEELS